MSFAAAFTGFANGFISGFDKGDRIGARRDERKRAAIPSDADAYAAGQLQMQKNNVPVPEAFAPDPDEQAGMRYAEGGRVEDPFEASSDAGELQTASDFFGSDPAAPKRAAIPTNEPMQLSSAPAPAGKPQDTGNPVTATVGWLKDLMTTGGGAVATDGPQRNPLEGIIDPTGRSYPDLSQTVGGIRAVTKTPKGREFSTADHAKFLKLRTDYIMSRGGNMSDAMKFNAQYLDNLRLQSMRSFGLASAAWDAGDTEGVQFFARQAYGMIPDGLSLKSQFKNGKLHAQLIDEKTGKTVGTRVMDKQEFLRTGTDIAGTTLSFGNHLADMEEDRKQKYRSLRRSSSSRGAGGSAAEGPRELSAAAVTNLGKAFKGAPEVDLLRGTALVKNVPGLTPVEAKALLPRLKKDGDLVFDDAGPKGPGIYDKKTNKLVHKANPGLGAAMSSGSKPAAGAQPAAETATTAPSGLDGATRAPGAEPSGGARAAAPAPSAPVAPRQAIPTDEPAGQGVPWDKIGAKFRDLGESALGAIAGRGDAPAPARAPDPPARKAVRSMEEERRRMGY